MRLSHAILVPFPGLKSGNESEMGLLTVMLPGPDVRTSPEQLLKTALYGRKEKRIALDML